MKYLIIIVGLAVIHFSCAGATPQDSLEGIDTKSKDQVCVRECSNTYSVCIQRASDSDGNRLVANDVLRACGGALNICVSTCPDIQ
ncbi:MAG: hypothetical protein DHS20C13_24190 [Thermodesulfobacteriota bacterium]|nr:MAG: hypothetical protein DHS20C13_24190 [Thermodesulfobacteriota bacterium]